MNIAYEPELAAYMERTGKRRIAVEVASSGHSDIEITEIFVHFVKASYGDYLVRKKRFRRVETGLGEVFLTPYRLSYQDTVLFGWKKRLFFRILTCQGIEI